MNALRLLFGTLTVLPVRPPTSVDRRTAGWAMTLAPLAGLALAVLVVVPLALVEEYADAPPLLVAALTVGALAVLTRAIHLDGLADVADGLGSGRHGDDALAIMKKSDIGPFGVVTLVLVLLVQVTALAECLWRGDGLAVLVLALVGSRTMLVQLCTPVYPPARADGLGSVVAGSVSFGRMVAAYVLAVVLAAAALVALAVSGAITEAALPGPGWALGVVAVATLPGSILARMALRRFGGVTGDVYGAVVETTFTAVLVVAALAG